MDEAGRDGPMIADDRIGRAVVDALRGQDLSGFELWRWLGSAQSIPGRLTEARLYATLYRLEAEGLLQSDWHEGERTRRRYRPTALASERDDEPAGPPDASRANQGQFGTPAGEDRRPVSPDPEAGSWFMPREMAPPTRRPAPPPRAAAASHPEHPAMAAAGPPAGAPPADSPAATSGEAGRPGRVAIAAYADDLGARLDLPRLECDRVRQEIADHLVDSAGALELHGYGSEAAAADAMSRLGSPSDQAALIEQAEQTPARLRRAIRRGALVLVAELVLWLFLSVAVLVVAPGVTDAVVAAGRLAGIHLAVLESAEWATNQVAAMVCLGAFAAGRLSMGLLARISRHGDATLRKPWAVGGAAGVLVVALLLPGYQDALTVATLLLAPLAFVAGTLRPQHANEHGYSPRGAAAAILLLAIATWLPFGRMFAYDPNATPGTPLAQGGSVPMTVFETDTGAYEYGLPQSTGNGVFTVELWPAATEGPFIVVELAATEATISGKAGVPGADDTVAPAGAQSGDLTKLPPFRQWWGVAVETGPNGQRTALDVVIQTGASPRLSSALGWLISKL